MFHAQLTGARTGGLSGSAIGEVSYTEAFPDLQFGIRMHASRAETLQTIAIRCLGNQPPALGTHVIDLAGAECIATYSRVLSISQPGTVAPERAEGITGTGSCESTRIRWGS